MTKSWNHRALPNILQLFPNVKRIVLLQMAVEMEKEMRDISANRSIQAVESISIHIFNLKELFSFFLFQEILVEILVHHGRSNSWASWVCTLPELQDVKY